jgi:hypothetical protein
MQHRFAVITSCATILGPTRQPLTSAWAILPLYHLRMSSTTAVATALCTSTIPAKYRSLLSESVRTSPVMLVRSASCLKGLSVALSTLIPCLFAPRFHGSPACSFLRATQVISLLPVQRGMLQPLPVRSTTPFDTPSGVCVCDSFARI